ncbi:Bug family tripartite tricarboxylate transporter substrate binding protein [Noviherbaspirillum aerium]|uniref:Bug family tripartite tricarboxylate transporter substrate binding protein n=1 Tax=Noviherbaspirillum aerium TaxID=2588497 RepID=UPI00124D73C3|nr:tripartite tricarboxylate transporter substrate binding protein [Noviherbaspirillum aerium]
MRRFAKLFTSAAVGLVALTALSAQAQESWPEKQITIIVPWAPGGSTDILARAVASYMAQTFGKPVIVENKPGASGNIGSNYVAKSAADGHTLLMGSMSTHAMNPAMMSSMPFDGVKSFAPIALVGYVTNTMVVHPSVPAKNVKEFIAYVKANPGKIAYATAGNGSTNHLSAALFQKATGIDMLHVPYKGGQPAVTDTVAGHTQLLFSAGTQTLSHVKAGKLNLLAVTESKRSPLLPNVPTVGETVPGYELAVWYGAFGPAGMPPKVVARLNTEINRILALPEVREKMAGIGVEVVQSTPDQFANVLKADAEKYAKVIRELDIKAE